MATQIQKYLAELIGTFLLVFIGTGTIVGLTLLGTATAPVVGTPVFFLMVSLAFGLTLAAIVYTFGHISGAHVNPAVTIGMLVTRRMTVKDAAPYLAVQVVGAIIASAVVLVIAQGSPAWNAAAPVLGATTFGTLQLTSALLAEVVLTFVLVWVVLTVTSKNYANPAMGGLAIGLTLAVIHFAGITFTGASVNPARSLGPAAFIGGAAIEQVWVYIVGPIIGGAIAAGAYNALKLSEEETEAETAAKAPAKAKTRA